MKKTTHLLIILLAIFFTSTLVLLYLNFAKTPTHSITPTTGIISTEKITPTITDSTVDWKTYENKEYGFSFNYPLGYELTENYVTPDHSLYYVSIMKLTAPAERKGYALTNTELKMEISVSKDNSKKIISGKQLKINNYDFWYTKSSNPGGGEGYDSIQNNISFKISKYPIETSLQTEFDQILSTFKFTKPTTESSIPKPISDFFAKINQKFGLNIVPTAENEFYSPSDMIAKKSWKLDLTNTPVDKSFVTFLHQQLQPNDLESGGVGGGGVDAYQNSQIKCYHIYGYRSGDPTNWTDPFSYLSCAEK